MKDANRKSRLREIAMAGGIILGLGVLSCSVLLFWGYLPGVLGESAGMLIGVLTSPFFMEFSIVVAGFFAIVVINHWRRHREGDEFVFLEDPPKGEMPPLLAQAEGAFAIGDFPSAAEYLAAMSEEELHLPETLALRFELAKATGKPHLAEKLETEIRNQALPNASPQYSQSAENK